MRRSVSQILTLLLVLFLCACSSSSGNMSANDMTLEKYEGAVQVSDTSKKLDPFAGMNLYDGYGVATETESYGWIMLDSSKLLKMDEKSRTSISKKDRHLKIDVQEGNLFFCVSEELKDDESLEFETTNMTLSIRGTTGIVKAFSERLSAVVLIEGEAQISTEEGTQKLSTGQRAEILTDTEGKTKITISDIAIGGDVSDFVLAEIDSDPSVRNQITDNGGQTDFLNEEERMAVLSNFLGTWEGNPLGLANSWEFGPIQYETFIDERGFRYDETPAYRAQRNAYNASLSDGTLMIPDIPIYPYTTEDRLRIIDDHTIEVVFGTMTLSPDASVLEIRTANQVLQWTRSS